MSNPLVSIIIPVYNTERFLRKCLDSVMKQTYSEWECICINDGSPDNSISILEEYGLRDRRFRIINQENAGLSESRNKGLELMRGDYFLFVDSDDFIHPQLLEICVYQAQRDLSDVVVYKWSRAYKRRVLRLLKFGISGYTPWLRRYKKEKVRSIVTEDIYKYVTDRYKGGMEGVDKWKIIRHCGACQTLYRSDRYNDLRFFTGVRFEDVPWWGQVLLRVEKATINNLNLYYYYPNMSSFTKDKTKMATRVSNMERIIPIAEEIYENAGPYQKKIWHERFIKSFRVKLERYRNQAALVTE